MRLAPLILALLLLLPACGSGGSTPATPVYVNRIAPTSAAVGDTVTVFGFGFDPAYPLDVVIINGVEALGTSWALVDPLVTSDEIEQLTFDVPAGLTPGAYELAVFALGQVSNTNVTITITP